MAVVKRGGRSDPNHLLLGSRWQPGTANNEMLVRLAARYVDVISVNYYTYAIEKSFLDRIHAWSGDRPLADRLRDAAAPVAWPQLGVQSLFPTAS